MMYSNKNEKREGVYPMVENKKKLRRNFLILLIVVTILAVSALFLFRVNRFSLEIRLEGPEQVAVSWGQDYLESGASAHLVGSLIFKEGIPLKVEIGIGGYVNTMASGTYYRDYSARFLNWEGSATRTVLITDREAPTITLNTLEGHFTIYGFPYEEEGYTAWDECDGDLTGKVEVREENGFVHYRVSDNAGNMTCVSRKIYYMDPMPPEITLLMGSTYTIQAGTAFTDPGWTAMDNCDGDLSHLVQVEGTVDIYRAGTYELVYTLQDNSGNEATVTRQVIVEPVARPATKTPDGKVIYLTFDDGPCAYTRQLLDVLDAYGVKATFFVVDNGNPELIAEIVKRGHAIGIHSVTHTYREIYASPEAFMNDLLTMQQIIYEASGVKTYLMRFPGGSSNTISRFNKGIMTYLTQAVQDCGFQYFDWNVDSMDAGGAKKAEEVFNNVVGSVQGRRVSVVLQHDIKSFSVEAVEKILSWGLANGYTFLPLDMTSPTVHHGVNN